MKLLLLVAALVLLVFVWRRLSLRRRTAAQTQLAPPLITNRRSPNFSAREDDPTYLVLHYTSMNTAEEAIERLCDPNPPKVSAHYLVDEEGKIYRLVDESNSAWHAGVSYWSGDRNLNGASIGIEIANQGDRPFAKAQMAAVKQLCLWILSRYRIPAHHVVGHSDIAPGRKPDPGPFFDWKGLAAEGIGVWPRPEQQDYDTSKDWDEKRFRAALTRYGYSPDVETKVAVEAFQRRFQPEVFDSPDQVGMINPTAAARLAWLLRKGM